MSGSRASPLSFDMTVKPSSYTLNFLCFRCRKAYKQRALRIASGRYVTSDVQRGSAKAAEAIEAGRHKCPQCHTPMVCAGRNVVVPPAQEDKEWSALEREILSRTNRLHRRRGRASVDNRKSMPRRP